MPLELKPHRSDRRTALASAALFAACVALASAAPAAAKPEKYEIDPPHFSVGFLVEHVGMAKIMGMFLKAKGSFTFDEVSKTVSDIRVVVDTRSVFTNHEKRDDHLRSPDFLNSSEFPEMVFVATGGEPMGDRKDKIHGTLELLGVTRPVTLDVTWNKSGTHPVYKTYATGISARGTFRRSEFGMSYAVANGWVGDEVELILEFEAIRQ